MTTSSEQRVVACVVTHEPGPCLAENLRALRGQVDEVLVVDNASKNAPAIGALVERLDCQFIGLSRNMGIGAALNRGVGLVKEKRADWLATFDQDSLLPEGAIPALLRSWQAHPQAHRIGLLCLTHQDRATGTHYHHPWDILAETSTWRELRSAITSGSLIRRGVLDEVGGFDESLFIDSVDHDFCLRARSQKWLIMEQKEQVLAHSIGAATQHRIFGRTYVCTNHLPVRRYYMARNQLEVARRAATSDPVWAIKAVLQLMSAAAAILLFESQRARKLTAMAQGVSHFLLRRFGPYS